MPADTFTTMRGDHSSETSTEVTVGVLNTATTDLSIQGVTVIVSPRMTSSDELSTDATIVPRETTPTVQAIGEDITPGGTVWVMVESDDDNAQEDHGDTVEVTTLLASDETLEITTESIVSLTHTPPDQVALEVDEEVTGSNEVILEFTEELIPEDLLEATSEAPSEAAVVIIPETNDDLSEAVQEISPSLEPWSETASDGTAYMPDGDSPELEQTQEATTDVVPDALFEATLEDTVEIIPDIAHEDVPSEIPETLLEPTSEENILALPEDVPTESAVDDISQEDSNVDTDPIPTVYLIPEEDFEAPEGPLENLQEVASDVTAGVPSESTLTTTNEPVEVIHHDITEDVLIEDTLGNIPGVTQEAVHVVYTEVTETTTLEAAEMDTQGTSEPEAPEDDTQQEAEEVPPVTEPEIPPQVAVTITETPTETAVHAEEVLTEEESEVPPVVTAEDGSQEEVEDTAGVEVEDTAGVEEATELEATSATITEITTAVTASEATMEGVLEVDVETTTLNVEITTSTAEETTAGVVMEITPNPTIEMATEASVPVDTTTVGIEISTEHVEEIISATTEEIISEFTEADLIEADNTPGAVEETAPEIATEDQSETGPETEPETAPEATVETIPETDEEIVTVEVLPEEFELPNEFSPETVEEEDDNLDKDTSEVAEIIPTAVAVDVTMTSEVSDKETDTVEATEAAVEISPEPPLEIAPEPAVEVTPKTVLEDTPQESREAAVDVSHEVTPVSAVSPDVTVGVAVEENNNGATQKATDTTTVIQETNYDTFGNQDFETVEDNENNVSKYCIGTICTVLSTFNAWDENNC